MPIVNIALDLLGLIIVAIIFISCLAEKISGEIKSNSFLLLLASIIVALVADIIAWCGEGNVELKLLTVVGNTLCICSVYFAMFCFMRYLKINLFGSSKAVDVVIAAFGIIGALAIIVMILNAIYGFAFYVNDSGHYVHADKFLAINFRIHLPVVAFVTSTLVTIYAQHTALKTRLVYISFALVALVCSILDFYIHGLSLTQVGLVTSSVLIYTHIYQQARRRANDQKMVIMLSQINPHFMYNSLTTMASLCDTSPQQAKNLIIDFSHYLRRNIDSLNSNELIPFEQELSHIECYLKIEKARFGERLNIIYSIQCRNFMVPALTIQPLVENAVKHGITKKPAGGTIRIITQELDQSYIIEIIDDGAGFDIDASHTDSKTHIGIDNVRQRLKIRCRATVKIKSKPNVGTRVTIEIPKNKKGMI